MRNNNISIVIAFQKRGGKRKSSVMVWFWVLIGWRAGGGVASNSRRTPSENEICEVIWGSISCFHQRGGLCFKCLCVSFVSPRVDVEWIHLKRCETYTIFHLFIFLSCIAATRRSWGFQNRDAKQEKKLNSFLWSKYARALLNSMALCWCHSAKPHGFSVLLNLKLGWTFQIAKGQKQMTPGWGFVTSPGWAISTNWRTSICIYAEMLLFLFSFLFQLCDYINAIPSEKKQHAYDNTNRKTQRMRAFVICAFCEITMGYISEKSCRWKDGLS